MHTIHLGYGHPDTRGTKINSDNGSGRARRQRSERESAAADGRTIHFLTRGANMCVGSLASLQFKRGEIGHKVFISIFFRLLALSYSVAVIRIACGLMSL